MAVSLEVCECCGHPLPTLEVQLELTPRQRAIFGVLQKAGRAGIPLSLLVERLYSDHPDGGPLSALNGVCVQRQHMQSKLAKFGMTITTSKGHGSIWRLEELLKTERHNGVETAHASA
ncbi:hypothetical protein ABIE87_006506 [Bradyrhizobium diazoefficiens]|uniref:hypothetical protein n=1 Tax=Bradyrhizobium diazoefficiens TaxID=1355477 RepID=UPI003510E42A